MENRLRKIIKKIIISERYNMKDVYSAEEYIPTKFTQNIEKKYKLSPKWKKLDNRRIKANYVVGTKYIVMTPEFFQDKEIEIHELGHYFYHVKLINEFPLHRINTIRKKLRKQFETKTAVTNIEGNWIVTDDDDEFVADLFKIWIFFGFKNKNIKAVCEILFEGKRSKYESLRK